MRARPESVDPPLKLELPPGIYTKTVLISCSPTVKQKDTRLNRRETALFIGAGKGIIGKVITSDVSHTKHDMDLCGL